MQQNKKKKENGIRSNRALYEKHDNMHMAAAENNKENEQNLSLPKKQKNEVQSKTKIKQKKSTK